MPFASTAQQRFAFGTHQPWAERWAHETDFSKLPKRVRLKLRMRTKDWSPAARAAALAARRRNAAGRGQTEGSDKRTTQGARSEASAIRRAGDAAARQIRAAGGVNKPPPKAPKGSAKKPAKGRAGPKPKSPEAQARQQEMQKRQDLRFEQGQQDREARLSRTQQHESEREQDRARREAERQAKLTAPKPAKGGGGKGGGKGSKGPTPEQQARERDRQARQQAMDERRARLGYERRQRQERQDQAAIERTRVTTPELADTARTLSAGKPLSATDQQNLVRNGLAKLGKDGALILTSLGLRAVRQKAERFGGKKRSALAESDFAGPNRTYPIMTAQDVADAARLIGHATDPEAVKRKIIAIAKRKKLPLPKAWQATKSLSTFYVFKDAAGGYRWVMLSSNAFRDRDKEIVSTKALTEDVARADADGSYGPLRWWHVGTPFGPGLDLGDCDFNAMVGRMLTESGTFRTPAIGAAVAAKADQLQGSIGFVHPPDEPDADGTFWHIRRFERSLVPRGKAANPFTQLIVKELSMDEVKVKALAELLGIPPEQVQSLVVASAKAVEQQAAASGVAFKADEPADDTAVAEKDDGESDVVTEDALPPDGENMMEPDGDENMLTPAECQQIAETVAQQVIAQLGPLLDLEKKMAAHVQSAFAPFAAKKDAEQAETKATIEKLQQQLTAAETRLKELEGDAPAAVKKGFKASESTTTVINPETHPLAQSQPKADPLNDFLTGFLFQQNGQPPTT